MERGELRSNTKQGKEDLEEAKVAFVEAKKLEEAVDAEWLSNDKAAEEELKTAKSKMTELIKCQICMNHQRRFMSVGCHFYL
eukprot:8107920-Ditylum_brightwellii.AAC.1